MKLVINASLLLQDQWTGVCRHVYYQILELARARPDYDIVLLFLSPRAMRYKSEELDFLKNVSKIYLTVPQRFRERLDLWWQELGWPSIELFTGKHDAYVSPGWTYLPSRAPLKGLWVYDLTCYDDLTNSINQSIEARRITTAFERQANLWITISEYTKRKLSQRFSVSNEHVICAYPGLVSGLASVGGVKKRADYFLYYGSAEKRKNLDIVLAAFDSVHAGNPGLKFKIVSKDWKLVKDTYSYSWLEVEHYVDDAKLSEYICQARALVYVSTEEGFGMPVLEALSLGTPVITSKKSSMEEICGADWPWLADPDSSASIAAVINSFIRSSDQEKEAAVARIQPKLKRFNYKNSAEIIWQALEQRL